ncbi:MAG: hypothetical protein LAP87_05040 [Acidobacteriia bacterium]|nr:hypothetical protein [Terriglobia bacterium]
MDSFLNYVTTHNAPAWRDEIFATLRHPDPPGAKNVRGEWSLEHERDLERIRLWIREAVNPASDLAQVYRKLQPGLDLEEDILTGLPAFERTPGLGPLEAHYSLRMLWRVLLRRHAIREAKQAGALLAAGEGRAWRCARRLSYYYPRLLVGVLLGFFTLGASSGVASAIETLRFHAWWPVPVGSIVLVAFLAVADVERRVGRVPGKTILARALRVLAFGIVYAALLAGIAYRVAAAVGLTACHYGPVPVMWGSVALVLGFVFQLFWQERSIGEPL